LGLLYTSPALPDCITPPPIRVNHLPESLSGPCRGLCLPPPPCVGRLRASSDSDAAGPEAAASWAACISLAARRSPQGPLPTSRMSPAARSSGRLAAVRRSSRHCRLARTRNPSELPEAVAVWAEFASLAARRSPPGVPSLHRRSRLSSCPCSAQDVAPSHPFSSTQATIRCERGAPRGRGSANSVVATARPEAGRLHSIPRDQHAMGAGTARLRGRPHGMLRARVVLGRAAA
jgi:hypothetical protein